MIISLQIKGVQELLKGHVDNIQTNTQSEPPGGGESKHTSTAEIDVEISDLMGAISVALDAVCPVRPALPFRPMG